MKLPKKFRLAIKAAKFSGKKRYQLAAVLFIGNRPVSIGFNDFLKSHPLVGNVNPLKRLHAEIDCLSNLKHNWDMDNSFLVVCRLRKDGSVAMSKPCYICEGVLREKGVKVVHYTTDGGYAKQVYL